MNVILNPKYGIRNNTTCSYICLIDSKMEWIVSMSPKIIEIPPLYGYILSQFDGDKIENTISHISKETGLNPVMISKFTSRLINASMPLEVKYRNCTFRIPSDILVEKEGKNSKIKVFNSENFDPFNPFIIQRSGMPINIIIMLTSKCHTNCIYCYADRDEKIDLESDKVVSLIDECHEKGVMQIMLSGGDIFAYKDWKVIMEKMAKYNYTSFISTKIPLKESDIYFLKECGIEEIQFSLDSADPMELASILKVRSTYIESVREMLYYCQLYDLKVNVKTVLSKYNSNEISISALYETLCKFNVQSWNIVPAFYSSYKGAFSDYSADEDALKKISIYLNQLKENAGMPIYVRILNDRIADAVSRFDTIDKFVVKNKGCLVTIYNMHINVYGKVVVCEMLYNKNIFHFDDIYQHSIEEIWNSKEMKDFYNFKIQHLQPTKDSACHTCESIKKCKIGDVKKVCLVDVITAYGVEKWDYPDPRCPRAPECNMELIIQ